MNRQKSHIHDDMLNDLLGGFDGEYSGEGGFTNAPQISGRNAMNLITSHNNFLAENGFTVENIKDDVISFKLPSSYSFFKVILVSENSVVSQNYTSTECAGETAKKNMKHMGISK